MLKLPISWLCLCLLAGCVAGSGGESTTVDAAATDPFAGRYPMIAWQSWTFEIPAGMEIGLDGDVRPATDRAKGNALVAAESIPRVLDAMRGWLGVRPLAQKAGFSEPGGFVFLDADGDGTQKAARLLKLQGHRTAAGLVCEVELYDTRSSGVAVGGSGQQLVPAGQAQVNLWRDEAPAQSAIWCMVLPTVLNSIEDLRLHQANVQSRPSEPR
jgi:hypothetical protein